MAEKMQPQPQSRDNDDLPSEQVSLDTAKIVTRIAVAWLSNPRNHIPAETVPALLRRIHEGLALL